MNLQELTDFVWKQTDTTEFDLPATTIASYIDEAFQRTIAGENRWPYYEQTWDVSVIAGDTFGLLDSSVNAPTIMSVVHANDPNFKLQQIDMTEGEQRFGSQIYSDGARPTWYSIWDRKIFFWPRVIFDNDQQFIVRGYRLPTQTFIQSGALAGEVDADPRLHKPLAHYAIALAYAAQEDEVLEQTYMGRWQRDVEMARQAIMDPRKNRPIVMYGNFPRTPIGGRRYGPYWGNGGVTINTP